MATSIARDELRSAMRAGGVTVVDALPAFPYGERHLSGALNRAEEDADVHRAAGVARNIDVRIYQRRHRGPSCRRLPGGLTWSSVAKREERR
jgi:hypothetical protein